MRAALIALLLTAVGAFAVDLDKVCVVTGGVAGSPTGYRSKRITERFKTSNYWKLPLSEILAKGVYPYVAATPTPGYVITASHRQVNAQDVTQIIDTEITQAEWDAQQEAAHQAGKTAQLKAAENAFLQAEWDIMGVSSGKFTRAQIETKLLADKAVIVSNFNALGLSGDIKQGMLYLKQIMDLEESAQDVSAKLNDCVIESGNPQAYRDIPDVKHE